jgi:hypothetical protein
MPNTHAAQDNADTKNDMLRSLRGALASIRTATRKLSNPTKISGQLSNVCM